MNRKIKTLGKKYIELTDEIKRLTSEKNAIQAELELLTSAVLEDKTLKSINIAEIDGRVLRVSEKKTLNLINDILLHDTIENLFDSVVSVKTKKEVKFADNNFKEAVLALLTDDFNKEAEDMESAVNRIFPEVDSKVKKALCKKLTTDTKRNLSLLKSLLGKGEYEEEILEVRLVKNRELIGRFFDSEDFEELKKQINRSCGISYSITTTIIESEEEESE